VLEWLQLYARWLHVLAGAAWIGTSFYFTWLNHSMRPPERDRPGVAGELWAVHGGGFYVVEKYSVAPERLPSTLHWFKWEAYTTWLAGFVLLVLVYYLDEAFLLDPTRATVGHSSGIAIGVGALVSGWILYDLLCRSPLARSPIALAIVLVGFAAAAAWGLAQILSARAALLHTGAMLGTWMAANVFFVIIPGQRAMVAAMAEGRAPDAERGRQGAMRSLHNNYMTLPVLFTMVGIHYPVAYATRWAWAILAAVFLVGIAARLYYNLGHAGRRVPWLLPAGAVGLVALVVATSPRSVPEPTGPPGGRGTAFPVVRAIVDARCVPCHASVPTWPTVASPPLGVVLESDAELVGQAELVGRVLETGTMPLGNVTGMAAEERALVLRWVSEGARAR
jgi:uncharacterized membrane protein